MARLPRLACLLALCLSCEGGEEAPVQRAKKTKGNRDAATETEASEVAVVEIDPIEQVRLDALAGRYETAVSAAQSLIVDHPEESILWSALEHASIAHDAGRSLLESISVDEPLAGEAQRSEALRQALVAAPNDIDSLRSRLAGAIESEQVVLEARVALLESPEAGFDRRAPRDSPASALVQLHRAEDFNEARAFEPLASGVEGADAAWFRAEAWLDMGETNRAFRELGVVEQEGRPSQVVDARLRMASLILDAELDWGEDEPLDAADSLEWAVSITSDALNDGDAQTLSEALPLVLRAALESGELEEGLGILDRVALVVGVAAGDDDQGAEAQAILAQLAFRAGHVRTALHAGQAGMTSDASAGAEAAWWGGLAAYLLEDGDSVNAAAERLEAALANPSGEDDSVEPGDAARASALAVLAELAEGARRQPLADFDSSELRPIDRAIVNPLVAYLDLENAVALHQTAVLAADESGDLELRIRTRLDLESELRLRNEWSEAIEVQAQLALLSETEAMRAELAARAMLVGEDGQGFPESDLPMIALWTAMDAGAGVTDIEDGGAFTVPIRAWTIGRSQIQSADVGFQMPYGHYFDAMASLPTYRQGRLSSGSVLDGSQGLPSQFEIQRISGQAGQYQMGVGLIAHEIRHRLNQTRDLMASAHVLTFALHEGPRADLLGSAAYARVRVQRWLSGSVDYPEEAFSDLAAAEAHIRNHVTTEDEVGYEETFHKLLPRAIPAVADLLEDLDEEDLALVSYQQFGEQIHAVAFCEYGVYAQYLEGGAEEVRTNASAHIEALREMAAGNEFDHSPGNLLRAQIFDPLNSTFSPEDDVGVQIGKFRIVGPSYLRGFNFGSIAEQQDGLRPLGSLRSFFSNATITSTSHNDRSQSIYFQPAFLGMTVPVVAEDEDRVVAVAMSDDQLTSFNRDNQVNAMSLTNSLSEFQSTGQILDGETLDRASWFEWIRGARYIYLTDFAEGSDGDFVLNDGSISLDEIRFFPIQAELVIIGTEGTLDHQIARASAFLDAGAQVVIVTGLPVPDEHLENIVPELLRKAKQGRVRGQRMALEFKNTMSGGGVASGGRFAVDVRGAFLIFSAE